MKGRLGLAAVLLLACYTESERVVVAPSLFTSSDDVERVRSNVVFDTLWVFGGPSDTLLAHPHLLRPDGARGVVFFDFHNRAVYRVGADGDLLWSWGSPGEGPGELSDVRALDVGPDGSVVLFDNRNRRVVRLSADGKLLQEVPIRGATIALSMAALSDGRMVTNGRNPRLAFWEDGHETAAELPPVLADAASVQVYGRVVRWGDDGWVFGFFYGNGWMRFQGTELGGYFPYVEHVDFPLVRQVRKGRRRSEGLVGGYPTRTGMSLSVVGDTLYVLFAGGVKDLDRRVLDKFDVRSGAYLATDILPHHADEAVVGGDKVFTVANWEVFSSVVALARREASGGQ